MSRYPSIICAVSRYDDSVIKIFFEGDEKGSDESLERLVDLPFPFINGTEVKCDFVLIPSRGTFLHDFKNTTGLHIGVTDDSGGFLEFNHDGLSYTCGSSKKWHQCLKLNLRQQLQGVINCSQITTNHWIEVVQSFRHCKDMRWSKQSYNGEHNNCFDFVLEFIQSLVIKMLKSNRIDESSLLNARLNDKAEFCKSFVAPETMRIARYITLHRKLSSGIGSITRSKEASDNI